MGSGQQHWSWISLYDLLDAIVFTITQPKLTGPINAVAPQSTSSHGFAQTLGRELRRPAILPLPRRAVQTLFGQMGEETLLADNRIQPSKLSAAGFSWRTPELESALRVLLGKMPQADSSSTT